MVMKLSNQQKAQIVAQKYYWTIDPMSSSDHAMGPCSSRNGLTNIMNKGMY